MTRNLRTLIYLLNLELREECSRTLGPGMESSKRNRDGLESSKRNRGAAVEADAIGSSSWKRRQTGPRGAAVEADAAIGPGAAAEATQAASSS